MITRATRIRDAGVVLFFILPSAIGFAVFFAYPTLRGFYLSLTDYSLVSSPEFIGFQNYRDILDDAVFWNAMWVTTKYVVINIGVQTLLALGLAVLLHRLTTSSAIRGIVMLPFLVSNVVVALVWFWLLDYNLGLVNAVMDALHIPRVAFFGDPAWSIPTIALINSWRHLGYTALLIFAGLQTIPRQLYEAGAIDGASEWRMFRTITLPLLRPVMALVLVITVIGSFQIFDTVAVTTKGGPIHATRVINYYIYDKAFSRNSFGYASALSVILFVVLAGLAIAQLRLLRASESDLA